MTPQQRQAERNNWREHFFDGKVPLTVPQPFVPNETRGGRVFTVPVTGGKTINQRVGGTGAFIFKDCDGAEVGRRTYERGLIIEDGELEITSGCQDDGSSIG